MERRTEEENSETSGSHFTIIDAVKKLAAHNARADLSTEVQITLFLKSWWSRTYNRPLKDPLLQSYTLEELLYEFYDRVERQKAEEERLDQESDKIEVAKEKAIEDWAEKMEREEREAEMRNQAAELNTAKSDPTKDPENIKWMEDQIRVGKQVHGDTFGEDIDDQFE